MPNAQPYRTTSSIATSEVDPAVSNPGPNPVHSTPHPSSNNKISNLIAALAAAVFVVATASGAALLYRARHSNTTSTTDIQSFTYGMVSGPLNTFYPHNGTNIDEIVVNEQIFEGLVTYRDKKIVGNLATSWKNPDANTWVFTLRPHVTFHTGRTMQASDVVASLKAVQGTEVGDLYGNTIQSVTALDSQTVQITTAAPDPILLNKLVFLYVIDSHSKQANSPINGTGPYTLAHGSKPSQKSLQLTAYNNYHADGDDNLPTRQIRVLWSLQHHVRC